MKKIFTLIFLVMASVAVMAQTTKSFTDWMYITGYDEDYNEITQATEENEVILTEGEDGKWNITFKNLQAPNGVILGDLTFKGINVKADNYGTYTIGYSVNEPTTTITDQRSKYVDKEIVLSGLDGFMNKYDNSLDFMLYSDEVDDIYYDCHFGEKQVDGVFVDAYYMDATSEDMPKPVKTKVSLINEEDGSVTVSISNLKDANTNTDYGTVTIKGLTMDVDEAAGVYMINTEDDVASSDKMQKELKVLSFYLSLIPNGITPYDGVDDDIDPGFGGGESNGKEFEMSGELVLENTDSEMGVSDFIITNSDEVEQYLKKTDYTDNLVISLDGDEQEPQEATISVTDEGDGTYTFVLKDFSFGMFKIGDVTMKNVEGKEVNGAIVYSCDADAEITNGAEIAEALGNKVHVKMNAQSQDGKLYAEIALPVSLGDQTLDVTAVFGTKMATAIKGIAGSSAKTGAARIYDLSGRQLQSLQKGINIIKMSDGKTVKVIK